MNAIRGVRVGESPLLDAADAAGAAQPAGGASFAQALGTAIGQVEALQLGADAEATKAANGAGNLHETALALEKADVGMRVLTKVRNKIVEAYQDVMRMGV
jgi:flagellar hook-basal body complex protein FliE